LTLATMTSLTPVVFFWDRLMTRMIVRALVKWRP
jgi:hypothetical protein